MWKYKIKSLIIQLMKVSVCLMHKADNTGKSCTECGCYCDQERGVHGLKTPHFLDPFLLDSRTYFSNLQQRAAAFVTMEPARVNPLVSEILGQLAEQFNLSPTTFAKGQYMLYHLLREKPQFQDQQLRYGAVCLYLSAKMTESYSSIPNLSLFGQHAHRIFEKHEYVALEEQVFEHVYEKMFNVAFFTEFLEYYQVKGVVLSNERVDQNQLPDIDSKIRIAALNYIRSGEFLSHPQEKLAAFILHQTRQELKVAETWNEHIESYTGFGTLQIYNVLKECRKKVVSDVPVHKRIMVKHSTSANSTNSSMSTSSGHRIIQGAVAQHHITTSTSTSTNTSVSYPQTSLSKMHTLIRSASLKSKLLAQPFRGIVKVLI